MKLKLPLSLPKLRAKADRLFSLKRRWEEADMYGFCVCITCGVRKPVKEVDAGHFVQREHLATRFEKNNVWPQCRHCNRFKGGRHSVYRDELIKIVGLVEVERLEKKKYETVTFSRSLFEKVIQDCK